MNLYKVLTDENMKIIKLLICRNSYQNQTN